MSAPRLQPSAQRVQEALAARGFDFEVREFPAGTRTSAEAAVAIGCSVGQIAKSMVFRARRSGHPVLVIASGANRVDEKKVGRELGEKIGRADAAPSVRARYLAIALRRHRIYRQKASPW